MKGERVCVVNALACASVCLVAVYAHIRITGVETQLEQAQAASFRSVEELQYQVALHQRFTCGMLQWLVGSSSGLHGNTQASPMARSQLLSVLLSVQQHSASLLASCGEIHAHGGHVMHLMRRLGSDSCGAGDGDMGGGGGVGGSSDCSAPESSRTTESNTSDTSNGSAAEWRMQRWCQRVLLSAPLCLDWRV